MARDVVPFGKYKGQPVEVLAADRDYCDWLAAQPWFRERFRDVYNVVVQMPGEERDTPEHNALQARFLDDGSCLALWRRLEPDQASENATLNDMLMARARGAVGNLVMAGRDGMVKAAADEVSPGTVAFYSEGGHGAHDPAELVRLRAESAKRRAEGVAWLEAAADFERTGTFWYDHLNIRPATVTDRRFEQCGFDVLYGVDYRASCRPYLDEGKRYVAELSSGFDGHANFLVECKPAIGDDYPAVLRQVLRARGAPLQDCYSPLGSRVRTHKVVVAGGFHAEGATLEQVRAIYAASGVSLVLLDDFS